MTAELKYSITMETRVKAEREKSEKAIELLIKMLDSMLARYNENKNTYHVDELEFLAEACRFITKHTNYSYLGYAIEIEEKIQRR